MRFFNIDLHISVIEDIKSIFADLGHSVDSVCLSNHNWVFGRKTKSLGSPYHDSTLRDVHGMEHSFTQEYLDAFYREYRDVLSGYDGFIVTYPPAFSLLYEKFEKPIYTVAAIRYDYPFRSQEKKDWLNSKLQSMFASKQLIPIANSKYDAEYWRLHGSIEPLVIPSLCSYVSQHGGVYTGTSEPIVHGKERIFPYSHTCDLNAYSWGQLYSHSSIIHVPYNVSTMSIFEQYTAGVPMLFPDPSFGLSFRSFLSEAGRLIQHDSAYQLMDFYDTEMMPDLIYFSSLQDLNEKLSTVDFAQVHHKMAQHAESRKSMIYDRWAGTIR